MTGAPAVGCQAPGPDRDRHVRVPAVARAELEEAGGHLGAETHTYIAYVKLHYDGDGAAAGFKRAIELKPSYVRAHHWHSHYCVALGSNEESLAVSLRALDLVPTLNQSVSILSPKCKHNSERAAYHILLQGKGSGTGAEKPAAPHTALISRRKPFSDIPSPLSNEESPGRFRAPRPLMEL